MTREKLLKKLHRLKSDLRFQIDHRDYVKDRNSKAFEDAKEQESWLRGEIARVAAKLETPAPFAIGTLLH